MYKNNIAEEVRSIRLEDICYLLDITVDEKSNKAYKDGKELESYTAYVGRTYAYKSGDYAPENYLKEVYPDKEEFKSLEMKKVGDTLEANCYGFYVYDEIINKDDILYDILIPKTGEDENCADKYWLANSLYASDHTHIDFWALGVLR